MSGRPSGKPSRAQTTKVDPATIQPLSVISVLIPLRDPKNPKSGVLVKQKKFLVVLRNVGGVLYGPMTTSNSEHYDTESPHQKASVVRYEPGTADYWIDTTFVEPHSCESVTYEQFETRRGKICGPAPEGFAVEFGHAVAKSGYLSENEIIELTHLLEEL